MHTYFSRHEEGSEEKPLHIESCRLGKPVKRKEQKSLVTILHRLLVQLPHACAALIPVCNLHWPSASIRPAGADISDERGGVRDYRPRSLVNRRYNRKITAAGPSVCVCVVGDH